MYLALILITTTASHCISNHTSFTAMKFAALLSFVMLAMGVNALPAGGDTKIAKRACDSAVTLSGNPFSGRTLNANSHYGNYVTAAAAAISDATLKAKALKVASVGTFLWL